MIDRTEYLQMCRECAMIMERGIHNIPRDVPESLRIVFNGAEYYPYAYTLSFNLDGSAAHTAVLHDLNTNAFINARLQDVGKVV